MKFYKSTNAKDINSLEKGKVRLTVNGEDPEGIWVAKDPESKKMYLLNNALAFYPIPSWGTEWDLAATVDVAEAMGERFKDTVLTFHKDAYQTIEQFIDNDNNFDYEKYLDQAFKESEETKKENE